jgi:hypothetical protein
MVLQTCSEHGAQRFQLSPCTASLAPLPEATGIRDRLYLLLSAFADVRWQSCIAAVPCQRKNRWQHTRLR